MAGRFENVDVDALADLLMDVDRAVALLSPEERAMYEDAAESVQRARDEAQRMGAQMWVF